MQKELAEALVANLAPVYERRQYYAARPELVREILVAGNARARQTARQTLREVREALGFQRDYQLWE